MAKEIYLSNVRLSFPKLIEAVANASVPNSKRSFGCDLIFPPNDPQFAQLMSEIGAVATEKWKDKAGSILQMLQNDKRLRCYGSGSEKVDKNTMRPWEGYGGGEFYLTCSSNEDRPPIMIRPNGSTVDNANTMERQQLARKLYGGCYVNAAVSLWCQDNQFGRAIRCNILAMQFAKDGQPFGEAPPNLEGKFGAVAESAAAPAAPAMPAFFGPAA